LDTLSYVPKRIPELNQPPRHEEVLGSKVIAPREPQNFNSVNSYKSDD